MNTAMNHTEKGGNGKRIAFLFLPYLLVIAAAVLLVVFVFLQITYSGYVQLLFNRLPLADAHGGHPDTQLITPVEVEPEEFPAIAYETQWATINVDGWKNVNIPVLLGDTQNTLRVGAGMPMHSAFCGQGRRVVLDAHVTTFFREVEDTPVGTLVHISTVYGEYTYRVDSFVIFDQDDTSYIRPNRESEQLVMYTCYPFDNGYRPRVQRAALICSLVDGKQWR